MSAELERILSNMIRIGTVAEVDLTEAAAPRVKMQVHGLVTDWMPFPAARAGSTKVFTAPRVGEQMAVFSPYGDAAQAFAGQSFFSDDNVAPSTSADVEKTVYPDGSIVEYNSANHTLTVTVSGTGNVVVNCKHATVNSETDVTVNTATATVAASTKVQLTTPLVECSANLKVGGALEVVGASTLHAVTSNGKNVGSTHTHTLVTPGLGASGPPP